MGQREIQGGEAASEGMCVCALGKASPCPCTSACGAAPRQPRIVALPPSPDPVGHLPYLSGAGIWRAERR
ncbi:hypothetical protein AAFF_G00396300 [Aldrovandia affinis]|uniref:Uncharacterized protein n=1 Tax=Aldrovandia affinis TaxID=143900 RepID=A0AAD7SFK3_9TELE|nr:hypothetical protein AAFF_G00396300 [Aldrovandia affinis]